MKKAIAVVSIAVLILGSCKKTDDYDREYDEATFEKTTVEVS